LNAVAARNHHVAHPVRVPRNRAFTVFLMFLIGFASIITPAYARPLPARSSQPSSTNAPYSTTVSVGQYTVPGTNRTYALGWIPEQVPDSARVMRLGAAGAVPQHFDWRDKDGYNWMTSVKDQGGCGSCVAFAVVGATEIQYRIDYNNPTWNLDLSEQHLFSCGGGSCSTGWTLSGALNDLKNYGTPDEPCFPYQSSDGTDRSCSATCTNWQSRVYKISTWSWLASGSVPVENALMHGPVLAAFTVHYDFFNFFSSNPDAVYYWDHVSAVAGGHAVAIIGYDIPGQYWIVKNSWGTSWGNNGYFKIGFGEGGIDDWAVTLSTPTTYTVTFYTDPTSGTITVNGTGKANGQAGTYAPGTTLHLTANPPTGYQFTQWETSGVTIDSVSSLDTYMTVSADGWLRAHFSPQVSMVSSVIFPAPAGSECFIGNTNPYDNQALLGVWAKTTNAQDIGLWTNAGWVDQGTGRPLASGNLVLVAGPLANKVVGYYQSQGLTASFRWANVNGVSYGQIVYHGQVLAQMRESDIGSGKDIFVVQTIRDGDGLLVLMFWGIGAQGTLASGVWFISNYSSLGSMTNSIYVYSWTDANGDKFPQPSEITLTYQGN